MNILKSITILTVGSALLLAAPQNKKNDEMKSVIKEGKKSSKILLKTLQSNLVKNMKQGGPMQALEFCSNEAYNLTQTVNTKLPQGVTIKRVSLKYRNPVNKPENDEAKVLEALHSLKESNVVLPKYFVEKIDDKNYKYYKPLVINKQACLKCHGDIQDQKLKTAIENRYPLDKATGYKMGDLRGAIVVTITKK